MSDGRAIHTRAAKIHCIVCGKSLATALWGGGWSNHLHAWDDPKAAAGIIAEEEAA
jgi:ABC-type transport system involved in cytochrome c biogenesis permease subunit